MSTSSTPNAVDLPSVGAAALSFLASFCLVVGVVSAIGPTWQAAAVPGLALSAIGAALATGRRYELRDRIGLIGAFVIPITIFLVGILSAHVEIVGFGIGFMGVGGIAWGVTVGLATWCCGTATPTLPTKPRSFQLVRSKDKSGSPLPMTLVLGALAFSLPGRTDVSSALALLFFPTMIGIASLGGFMGRVRALGTGRVEIDAITSTRWIGWLLALMALTSALAVGGGIAFGNRLSRVAPTFGGVTGPMSRPTQISGNAASSGGAPQSVPPWLTQAILAIALLIAVAFLLWLGRKYGRRILDFLRRLVLPIKRLLNRIQSGLREIRRERLIQRRLASMEDPFEPLPDPLDPLQLARLFDTLEAHLALLGTERRASETASAFVRRAALNHPLDRVAMNRLVALCVEAEYGSRTLSAEDASQARAAWALVEGQVDGFVSPAARPGLEQAVRRQLAINSLGD